jgi:hypothetical protein
MFTTVVATTKLGAYVASDPDNLRAVDRLPTHVLANMAGAASGGYGREGRDNDYPAEYWEHYYPRSILVIVVADMYQNVEPYGERRADDTLRQAVDTVRAAATDEDLFEALLDNLRAMNPNGVGTAS